MANLDDPTADASRRTASPWRSVLLVVALTALVILSTRSSNPPEGWRTDYASALADARATDRRVLIAFHSDGCPPCHAMERDVLRAAEVREQLDGFVPVRVDAGRQRELSNKFGVLGTPTYAVVDPSGEVVARCDGYQPVKAFVAFLKTASARPGGARP